MSSASSHRMQRVADQIQRELAQLLTNKAHDPRFHTISITEVNVSPDMKNATVYISLLDNTQVKPTLAALKKAAGFFRSELAHAMNLRVTPKLKFAYDDSLDRGRHLADLLNEIKEKEEESPRGENS